MTTATYSYPCPACGGPIHPGDQVRPGPTGAPTHPRCSTPPGLPTHDRPYAITDLTPAQQLAYAETCDG